MTAETEPVPLLVTLGHVGGGSLNLRFPLEYREEILALLDENEIDHSTAVELSAGPNLWIEIVQVLAGPGVTAAAMGSLASVIKTIVRRHDGKKFVLKQGEFEVEATGYSEKAVEEFLKQRVRDQAEQDAETRRVLGISDKDKP